MSDTYDDLSLAMLDWMDRFAPYGVFATDRDLRIRRWNQWMKAHSGLDASEVIGQRIIELYPDLEKRHLAGHFSRALKGEVSVLSTALHGYLLSFPSVTRDSSYDTMRQTARIAPLFLGDSVAGIIAVIEDVTHRESQAGVLRKQHARDEILAWALAHLLKSEDPQRACRELFFKVAEHLDFDSYALFLQDKNEREYRLVAAGGLTSEQETAINALAVEGLVIPATLKGGLPISMQQPATSQEERFAIATVLGFAASAILPLMVTGDFVGFLAFGTKSRKTIAPSEIDLLATIAEYLAVALSREKTNFELRRVQAELNEHAYQLEGIVAERTSALKQIIAELQTFSYTVAHDLRAPIRAVKGYADVLMEDYGGELSEEAKSVTLRLRNASMQMDALTRDLLEFTKVSRQELNLEVLSLDELVSDAVEGAPAALRSCVRVVRPIHPVLGHRTLVLQCIENLIGNALKFVPPGVLPKLTIWSELMKPPESFSTGGNDAFARSQYNEGEKVGGDDSSKESCVRVWFQDEGIGVLKDAQSKIFGIFERGVTLEEYEGTGIGLAIVARAMERMGGSCGVESEPGKGSSFWLQFQGLPKSFGIAKGETTGDAAEMRSDKTRCKR
ncbi:MAG TPA: ATP-binding protein [Candidatus Kapabacteria bacterium]|nr:ATP-binding protein [Candidatus Kapabacteria bacterium]